MPLRPHAALNRRPLTALALAIALIAAGVLGGSQDVTAAAADEPCGVTTKAPKIKHVIWIILENRDLAEFMDPADAPYFTGLAARCGLADDMHAIAHPSLPNYIALTSGSRRGVTDDGSPADHPLGANSIFGQLGSGGWRTLAESMPGNCHRSDSGRYVPRHNPATYFTRVRTQCRDQDVPLSRGLALSAPFTLVIPDQIHNTHDSDVATGDRWLARFVPTVLGSRTYQRGRTAVFITFDEAENAPGNGNRIATLVVSPGTRPGTVSKTRFTHYSLLRTTQELLGLPLLGKANSATSMRSAFNLRPGG
jgi:phosphatidylinositol-3-phosphatase